MAGNALGVQDGFNFGSFATSVLSAGLLKTDAVQGLTGSLGNSLNGVLDGFGKVAANAIVGNVINQGIGNLTGQQSGFSWSSLAASAVAATATASLGKNVFHIDPNTDKALYATTNAVVSGLTRVAIQGGHVQWEAIASDALTSYIQYGGFGGAGKGSARGGGYISLNGNLSSSGITLTDDQKQGWSDRIDNFALNKQDYTDWLPGGFELDSGTGNHGVTNQQVFHYSYFDEDGRLADSTINAADFGFEQTGGGARAPRFGFARGPFEPSLNARAANGLDALANFDQITGIPAAYRDTADAVSLLDEVNKQSAIDKIKNSFGLSGYKLPTMGQLGVSERINGDGTIYIDRGELLNGYREAARLLSLHQQGAIELDFNTYRIKTIGTDKLTPGGFD